MNKDENYEIDYIEGRKNYYWHASEERDSDDDYSRDNNSNKCDGHQCNSKTNEYDECDECERHHCNECPTGATTQLRGLQVQLQSQNVITVAPGAPIMFDTIISPLSSFISYNLGVITITQSGVFYINWWVSTNSMSGGTDVVPTFSINTGGIISASSPIQKGQMSGNALITVTASPAFPVTLSLVNSTNATIAFGTTPIKADLTIVNVTF